MKVFISWSGPRSQKIAEIFCVWLPSVLQAIIPYFTPNDIDKGTRWASHIAGELETSDVGLLLLTPENITAPWILFEAGALSKKLDASKVCPVLFGMEPSDLTGPLPQFQLTVFNKSDVLKLMMNLNQHLGERALEMSIFNNIFEMFWPKLEADVQEAMLLATDKAAEPKRKERELLEEVLELTRKMAVQLSQTEKGAATTETLNEAIMQLKRVPPQIPRNSRRLKNLNDLEREEAAHLAAIRHQISPLDRAVLSARIFLANTAKGTYPHGKLFGKVLSAVLSEADEFAFLYGEDLDFRNSLTEAILELVSDTPD